MLNCHYFFPAIFLCTIFLGCQAENDRFVIGNKEEKLGQKPEKKPIEADPIIFAPPGDTPPEVALVDPTLPALVPYPTGLLMRSGGRGHGSRDQCPDDPDKTTAGTCGCGVPDTDEDHDGFAACIDCDDTNPLIFPGSSCLSDSNDCTIDTCDSQGSGECLHTLAPVATPCGDQTNADCNNPNTCSAVGTCLDNLDPAGTTCGDQTDADCNNPNTCSAVGTCLDNLDPAGTACGDQTDADCNNPNTCNAVGGCLDNFDPLNSICGDNTNTDCTNPDTCNATGTCLSNNAAPGTVCDDASNSCTINATCGMNGTCSGTIPDPCVTFTGHANTDFANRPNAIIIRDYMGLPEQDVAGGATLPNSGWDIKDIYLQYDNANDILYVGVDTFFVFSDADANNDTPTVTGATLNGLGGIDASNLGLSEYFAFGIDNNNDSTFEYMIGKDTTIANDYGDFDAYIGGISTLFPTFGTLYPATVNPFTLPGPPPSHPHLEFSIEDFKADFLLPMSNSFRLQVGTGSINDDGIGQEQVPNSGFVTINLP